MQIRIYGLFLLIVLIRLWPDVTCPKGTLEKRILNRWKASVQHFKITITNPPTPHWTTQRLQAIAEPSRRVEQQNWCCRCAARRRLLVVRYRVARTWQSVVGLGRDPRLRIGCETDVLQGKTRLAIPSFVRMLFLPGKRLGDWAWRGVELWRDATGARRRPELLTLRENLSMKMVTHSPLQEEECRMKWACP
jgi:hypothetical protein